MASLVGGGKPAPGAALRSCVWCFCFDGVIVHDMPAVSTIRRVLGVSSSRSSRLLQGPRAMRETHGSETRAEEETTPSPCHLPLSYLTPHDTRVLCSPASPNVPGQGFGEGGKKQNAAVAVFALFFVSVAVNAAVYKLRPTFHDFFSLHLCMSRKRQTKRHLPRHVSMHPFR